MINIKNIFYNEKYHKIIKNFSALTFINIINKLLPLLVVPFIVRTIGVEKFGIISFFLSIISYLILITQYSFFLTATKYISMHRDNIEKVSQHFWLVLSIRMLFLLIISMFFFIALFSIDMFSNEKEVFLFTFFLVCADVIMPLWFFRGIEEMKYLAIFNIIAKIFYAFFIFLIIQEKDDYIWIPLLNSLSLLMVNGYALYFAIRRYHIQFILPSFQEIKKEIITGKDIFLSNISVSFYTTINILLLGFLTTYTEVGIYALAEALFMAYNSIIKSYTMVIYPHLAKYLNQTEEFLNQARKFFFLYLMILSMASFILFLSSEFVITFLYGKGHIQSIEILKIFALALLFEPLGGFFTAYLSLKSKYKLIRSITFKTMIVNLLLIIPVIWLFKAEGLVYLFLFLSILQVFLNIKGNREVFMRSNI